MALDLIGQPNITSFSDSNYRANRVDANYPIIRNEVQRRYPWRRLTERVQIAKDASDPAWGYDHQYSLPSDCLRVLEVYVDDYPLRSPWNIEQNKIRTDSDGPIRLRYIKLESDPTQWDSIMITAVAYRLAEVLSMPLANSPSLKNEMRAAFREQMAHARATDAIENQPPSYNTNAPFLEVRHGALGGYNDSIRGV